MVVGDVMMDYDKLIEALRHCSLDSYVGKCEDCPLPFPCDGLNYLRTAADAIEELLAKIATMQNEIEDISLSKAVAETIVKDYERRIPKHGVVHCRNCYHAEHRNPIGKKTEIYCRLFIAGTREDDFCSYGKFLTNCGAKMEVSE